MAAARARTACCIFQLIPTTHGISDIVALLAWIGRAQGGSRRIKSVLQAGVVHRLSMIRKAAAQAIMLIAVAPTMAGDQCQPPALCATKAAIGGPKT